MDLNEVMGRETAARILNVLIHNRTIWKKALTGCAAAELIRKASMPSKG